MKSKIWIVNFYTTPPDYVTNPRHLEFSHYLQASGYDVTIFSAGYWGKKDVDMVPKGKKFQEAVYEDFKFVHMKVNHFEGNGINRMFAIFQFACRLFWYCKKFVKPDIIIHNIHAPFDYPVCFCARKLKAKYIVEAWDFWPKSFVDYGLIKKSNPLLKMAYAMERSLYYQADKIVFTMEGGLDYLNDKGWTLDKGGKVNPQNVYYINNGVNIKKFALDINNYQIVDKDLEDDSFKVIYMGSIRLVNNLKQLIDAAKILKSDTKIKFLLYGDGTDRLYLEEYCKKHNIKNVVFKEKSIPFNYVPYVLSKSSLNIMNYQKNFGKYGASSGKLFQYLAAGKPICTNIEFDYCIIKKNNLGIASELDTPEKYAQAIKSLVNMPQQVYNSMCKRVRDISVEFDFNNLSNKLVKVIESLNL